MTNSQVVAYNVLSDYDEDILNQNSLDHIKTYFEEEKEEKEKEKYNSNNTDTVYLNKLTKSIPGEYSINSVSFLLKILILIYLLYILCDFVGFL